MKMHSLRSVLLTPFIITFEGVLQFRNSRKIQEGIIKNKSKHSCTKDLSRAENERTFKHCVLIPY